MNILMLSGGVQAANGQAVSVADAIALALAHNPTIAAAEASIAAANEGTKAAQGARLPTLNVTTGVQRSDAPLNAFGSLLQQRSITATDFSPARINRPGYITNYSSQATLALPLYHGGAISAAIKANAAQGAVKEAQQRQITQQIIAAVITMFIAAKSSEAEISARQQELAAAKQQMHDIAQMQQQGMALESDTMDAKAHLLQSKLALVHSQNAAANAISRLHQLTTDHTLTVGGDITLRPVTGTVEQWVDNAVKQRMDLAALLAQRQRLAHYRAIERASWLPSVDLVASQQWNSSSFALRNRNSTIGATVSLNLFNGGSDRARLSALEARQAAADANIAEKKDAIRQQVEQRWRQWQEAQLQLNNARQLLRQRREALRIRKLRHQQGLETSSELLRTQVAHDVAQVATIRARYGLLAATVLLYRDAGILSREVVQ
ncbi:MAG: TolC family protein [Mariprofundales bacterium]